MTGRGFASAHIDEIAPLADTDPNDTQWRPVRHHFGIRGFGVNSWTGRQPGHPVIEPHDEAPGSGSGTEGGHEELYVVLSGHAEFTIAGERVDAPAGTLVYVEPGVMREARARDAGTTVLAIGGAPGEPFVVSPWEEKHTRGLVAG
jgi:hypothetical protein